MICSFYSCIGASSWHNCVQKYSTVSWGIYLQWNCDCSDWCTNLFCKHELHQWQVPSPTHGLLSFWRTRPLNHIENNNLLFYPLIFPSKQTQWKDFFSSQATWIWSWSGPIYWSWARCWKSLFRGYRDGT